MKDGSKMVVRSTGCTLVPMGVGERELCYGLPRSKIVRSARQFGQGLS